jgi:hypothetical protein
MHLFTDVSIYSYGRIVRKDHAIAAYSEVRPVYFKRAGKIRRGAIIGISKRYVN